MTVISSKKKRRELVIDFGDTFNFAFVRMKIISNMQMDVQILRVTSLGESCSSCIVIDSTNCRYLFNVPEGTQRLCSEMKIRLSKLSHVYLTDVSPFSVGGLPGLILTLSDSNCLG